MPPCNPELLVLNGPPGVGKTTVAACLRGLLPGTVVIDGDALRTFTPENARDYLGGGSTYRAAAVLAGAYVSMGAPRVVFDYVFLNERHVAYFTRALPDGIRPQMFTLWAPLGVVAARESVRPNRKRLGGAVSECHTEIAANLRDLGQVVDAGGSDPSHIAQSIHELALSGTA